MDKECSFCDREYTDDDWEYCPYCGHELEEVEEDEDYEEDEQPESYSNGNGYVYELTDGWLVRSDIGEEVLPYENYSFNDTVDYLNNNYFKLGTN